MDTGHLIIDLKTIPADGPKHFEFCLEKGWWHSDDQDDQIMGIRTPIAAKVDIFRAGDKYAVKGEMAGSIIIRCDRCLNPFDHEIETGFKLFFAKPSRHMDKAEIELLEEDMETGFLDDDEINLNDIFKEQLYLSLPIKSLCKEECLGLCPLCGMDLNVNSCQCRK
jgi:uncharacterized protein